MTAALSPKFAVYRLFNADGQLLYVGSTTDAGRRIGEHRRQKSWGADIARVRIQVFTSSEAMALAERTVIDVERPQHNRMRYLPSDRVTQQGIGKTPNRTLRIPDDEWAAWKAEADRLGVSLTDFLAMRSEHKTTGDEWDITTGWRKIMCTYKRAGRKKAVKVQSHRLDRRVKTSKLRDWEKDY